MENFKLCQKQVYKNCFEKYFLEKHSTRYCSQRIFCSLILLNCCTNDSTLNFGTNFGNSVVNTILLNTNIWLN